MAFYNKIGLLILNDDKTNPDINTHAIPMAREDMIDQDIFKDSIEFTGIKVLLYISDTLAVFEQRDGNGRFPFQIDLIGGGRASNETPVETLIREVFEETNLTIEATNVYYAKACPSLHDPLVTAFFFVVKLDTSSMSHLKHSDEGLGLVLLNPSTYINLENGIGGQQTKVKDYLAVEPI